MTVPQRLALCAALAVALLLADAYFAHMWLEQRRARREFVPVPAVVLSSMVARHEENDGPSYRPEVTYRYEVQGRSHVGHDLSVWRGFSSDRAGAEALVARHPVGAEVTAYVDPQDPSRALLDPSASRLPWMALLVLVPFHLALVSVLRGTLARRRADLARTAAQESRLGP